MFMDGVFLFRQHQGSPVQRHHAGTPRLAVLGGDIDHALARVNIPPAQALNLPRANAAPEHEPHGGIHAAELRQLAAFEQPPYLAEPQRAHLALLGGA